MFRWFVFVSLVACAAAEQSVAPDAAVPTDGASPPQQPPSAGECAEGQHACGPVCFPRQQNDPALGCALGCGTACAVPEHAIATCTTAGTCDFTCGSGLVRAGNSCVAASCEQNGYTCGVAPDGNTCGTCWTGISCGADLQCDIPADAQEWNDTWISATWLGDFNDRDDTERWLEGLSIGETIQGIRDDDWFEFHITDGFDGGNPDAAVELTRRGVSPGWLYTAHELTVWFACDTADAGSTVSCGEWYALGDQNSIYDPWLGTGCTIHGTYLVWADIAASCTGTADSGTVTIRVRKQTPPRGDRYDLRVAVE